MPKPDFTLKIIKDAGELHRLSNVLVTLHAFALDIETTEWWNRHSERIALIQIAFRAKERIKVFIIDALARFDPEPLRLPLEKSAAVKIIHNAAFDATRLSKHYGFNLSPVFDTMRAARRSGERKYSLKAQAETHLNFPLDKSAQTSDWSRRPLDNRQLYYAALDPFATLLLYENQLERGISGNYRLKPPVVSAQNLLPLDDLPADNLPAAIETTTAADQLFPENSSSKSNLSETAIALLGIITELPTRYSPDALAASTGSERVGLAGWIIDRRLGKDAEPDEEEVKMAINSLCEEKLVRITETRRLESTAAGERLWRTMK
jgi:DNA polymerase III epsilon subunit-like protein